MVTSSKLEATLHLLGLSEIYRGYPQTLLAVELALEDDARLHNVVKEIYWPVAQVCRCSRSCVERNIRTLSHTAWRENRRMLSIMAGYPLPASPRASEFIAILTAYCLREESP